MSGKPRLTEGSVSETLMSLGLQISSEFNEAKEGRSHSHLGQAVSVHVEGTTEVHVREPVLDLLPHVEEPANKVLCLLGCSDVLR